MNALERPPVAPGLSAGHPTPKEPRLPPLREDLRLHEGPDADDGSPTWVLEDPARDQFFQLGVFQAECLKRWHLGTAKAVAAAVAPSADGGDGGEFCEVSDADEPHARSGNFREARRTDEA